MAQKINRDQLDFTVETLKNHLDTIGLALDSSPEGFAIWKLLVLDGVNSFNLVFMNKAGAGFAGKTQLEITGRNLGEVVGGGATTAFEEVFLRALNLGKPTTEVVPSKSEDGFALYFENTVVPLGDGLLFVTYRDVTEATREHTRLLWLSEHDYLTGVPNRAVMQATLAESINWANANGGLFSFCFIDIDYFKTVNDTYGHDVGDALLVYFVKRIKNSLPKSALVVRIAGDEFAVILTNLKSEKQLNELISEVFSAMNRPFTQDDLEISITCSAGCVLTDGSVELNDLITMADQAMYRAKHEGRNRFRVEVKTETI